MLLSNLQIHSTSGYCFSYSSREKKGEGEVTAPKFASSGFSAKELEPVALRTSSQEKAQSEVGSRVNVRDLSSRQRSRQCEAWRPGRGRGGGDGGEGSFSSWGLGGSGPRARLRALEPANLCK